MRALARYPYLSSRQVCRLLYRYPASLSWAQAKLKHLTDLGFLERVFLPRPTQFGSAPSLYALARPGRACLEASGLDVPHRSRPHDHPASYLFLHHTSAVHDCLIALELLARTTEGIELRDCRPERMLQQDPGYVDDGPGRRVAVIPDAWVRLVLHETEEVPIAFEVDRGSEEQKRWRAKVRHLVAWSQGPYAEQFATTALTVAVIATPGPKRLHDLLHWTERELTTLGATHQADLFRLTYAPLDAVSPEQLFFAPRWIRPFTHEASALFDVAMKSDETSGQSVTLFAR